tara:strand:- start:1310 stop:1504 length:195 start_codon:yes stop_codon:yes gene_type:complete
MKFNKYTQNLSVVYKDDEKYIKSYNTLVALCESPYMFQLGYWSMTTQKHINYAAKELGLILIKK